jgi:hypothetical protein
LLKLGRLRFFFWSNEGERRDECQGLRRARQLVERNKDSFQEQWNEYFHA